MSGARDWPYDKATDKGRPWFLTARDFLFALFPDPDEALRARQGLLAGGVADADVRLYTSDQILSIESERSEGHPLARAIAAVTAERSVKKRYLDTAKAGGTALWAYAPTEESVNRFIRMLADYAYILLRYYGPDGVVDIRAHAD